MSMKSFVASTAAALMIGLGALGVFPSSAEAQTFRVSSGTVRDILTVVMNRAVVVETDTPFVELSIANPGIADISTLSDRSIYVLGKAPGRTTLTILGADGQLVANIEVQVSVDVAEFRERLRQILPNEPIDVRTANDGIVLSGTVSSAARLDAAMQLAERYAEGRVSNLMTVGGTQQVMLRVRFSEVSRSVSQALSASVAAGHNGTVGGTGAFNTPSLAAAALAGTVNGSGNNIRGAMTGGFNIGAVQFQVMLEALESNGLARTLSEPSLTALSGEQASFLAGGEVPVPVVGDGGSVSVEYRPFGVELTFSPTVLEGNLINLSLNASVSSIDQSASTTQNGIVIPGFRRRQTSTTVELRDGESFAVAGLLQDDFQGAVASVPWVGDIPILGALFRSTDYSRGQSELMIFITAHLVTPTRGEALALPTDRIQLPSEGQLFLRGELVGARGAAAEVARQDYRGSYGYVLD